MNTNSFDALVVDKQGDQFKVGLQKMKLEELSQGEVVIRVHYSSLNYKDGLACIPNGGVVRSYLHIPGIDLAGTVVSSMDSRFSIDQKVIVTGFGLGVSHSGGFSTIARVPADWIVPLPPALELDEAMVIGTAGLTAALSIERLEHNGLNPQSGAVLVTGATGGVGSFAVALLAARGYRVAASTGKSEEHDYLRMLGAHEIISREALNPSSRRPLEKQAWAAAVDPVGGSSLAYILASLQYGGSVAVSGLTGGGDLPTTVHPFILRGANLLGIDSVHYPIERRYPLWEQIADDLKFNGNLKRIGSRRIRLSEIPTYVENILDGRIRGRVVIEM
ncbi:putative quinone oxidoreductase, YhdH/YhfP family [Paenibacillus sp. 1_12]|uniref:acrylyl-CoA reductase family protein n=1 Tax=Paenibacillus sp. 1_12 TaxID=1566278 RepID=UPI0008EA21C4|nr:acryloyl-CoA reductase [Paenibacillus sp. 1_12]SFL43260.1 putative quinone oxidoreductase, YhdH/YhfP family [Paenibacillus sp. 1_12]